MNGFALLGFALCIVYSNWLAWHARKDFKTMVALADRAHELAEEACRQRDVFDHERRCLQRRLAKIRKR